jgi:hypothetical protein
MKNIQIIAGFIVILLAGCGQSDSSTTKEQSSASPDVPLPQPAVLTAGGTAYVRIKQYSTLSGKPTMTDMYGGSGYVLKNLFPAGIEAPIAQPTENDASFSFGESLKLIEKKDGLPTFWLVAKAQTNVWVPAYILTANKAEVAFLKDKNTIPETMAFVYDDGNWKVWGVLIGGIGGTAVIDSHGIVMMDYREGTSPFALKGNAVVFDASIAKAKWDKPPVFDEGKRAFQLSPACLYYCVSEGDKPAFECIDLAALKLRK